MVAYRFCRTDDWGLLADASNRCWAPAVEGAWELDQRTLKRLVREVQLWASSCMVALEGDQVIAVMFGCKRDDETLIERVAVVPRERRRGHGRHLITSLGSKLAILGPPRLVAELPAERHDLEAFLSACAFNPDEDFVDWELGGLKRAPADLGEAMVVPFSVADLVANELAPPPERVAWRRGRPALQGCADDLDGLAVASFDGIEAHLLASRASGGRQLLALGAAEGPGRLPALRHLLASWLELVGGPLRLPSQSEAELPWAVLEEVGFVPRGGSTRWTAVARPA